MKLLLTLATALAIPAASWAYDGARPDDVMATLAQEGVRGQFVTVEGVRGFDAPDFSVRFLCRAGQELCSDIIFRRFWPNGQAPARSALAFNKRAAPCRALVVEGQVIGVMTAELTPGAGPEQAKAAYARWLQCVPTIEAFALNPGTSTRRAKRRRRPGTG